MRVLYFTRDYTPHDHRFLSALAGTEHEVVYLRLERRGRQLEDRALPPEVQQVSWAGGKSPARLRGGPRLLRGLKRVIAQVKPDLIHAGPLQTVGLLAALSGFHPLVTMPWGSDLMLDADKDARYRWATRYVLRRSDVMVGDCEAVRQKAIAFGMEADRIVTFPWGVDLAQFSPGEDGGLRARKGWEENFVLLSTRSWEPVYGVDALARAFVLAAQQRPELRLFMLGGGSQAGLLRQIVSRGGVQDKVYFPGRIGQDDLPRYYRAADLYLSASHSDGSSVSLMESLACGCPALVSDIPGNREWVTPGQQGWQFPDGDPQALAKAILRAVEERGRLPEMAQAARSLAEDRADWNKNFKELLRAYEIATSD